MKLWSSMRIEYAFCMCCNVGVFFILSKSFIGDHIKVEVHSLPSAVILFLDKSDDVEQWSVLEPNCYPNSVKSRVMNTISKL